MKRRSILAMVSVAAVATAVFWAVPGFASAAKGGKTAAAPVFSNITLNQDPSTLHLGSPVTFSATWTGLSGTDSPQIGLSCYQGATLVFGDLEAPDYSFVLGGGSSKWLMYGGGASCTATLYAYGSKSGIMTVRELASTSFAVS
jgi:hypothetical protein